MIKYNFDRVFKARGVNRPFTYLVNGGFSDKFATKVTRNMIVRLGLKEMEKLCMLLRCTPNDFLEWVPNEDSNVDAEHPMQIIRKSDKVIDITKTLSSIPLGRLDEIEQMIQEQLKIDLPNKD